MNIAITVTILYLLIFTVLNGNLAEETTASSCPMRPATDYRGPPGIPGKPGHKGNCCYVTESYCNRWKFAAFIVVKEKVLSYSKEQIFHYLILLCSIKR